MFIFLSCRPQAEMIFRNTDLPFDQRVDLLMKQMTLEEKISQMRFDAPAISRLGIPEYNWWNECLHGVARAGRATVFPQAIGLAAMWDQDYLFRIAEVISDEARAKYHEFNRKGQRGIYQGLTFWSPNINIFRDPRWGRGMETYGEDPYLTGRLGAQFIKGLQGSDSTYLKVVATAKHFAVHSGPEPERHSFDARVDERDLRETYLPHFQMAVQEGKAYSIMCAYNRFLGDPCCGSVRLLNDILRGEWNFQGYVVSDCWALVDFYNTHKVVATPEEAAAMALKAGTDLNCGIVYRELGKTIQKGFVTEDEVNAAVRRLFLARMKLGMFDPDEIVPYADIPYSVVDCAEHAQMALQAAQKSIVLLKNQDHILPLNKNIESIAVIGPNANDIEVLLGNYNGTPSHPITPLQAIMEKVTSKTQIFYSPGSPWAEGMPILEVMPDSVFFTSDNEAKQNGLVGEYYAQSDFKGKAVKVQIDSMIDFNWWDRAPFKGMDDDNFSIRWTGFFVPPVTGLYSLGGNGFSAFRLYLDEKLLVDFKSDHHPFTVFKEHYFNGGKSYKIKLEFIKQHGDANMKLLWAVPNLDYMNDALKTAQKADVIIMCMGLSPRLEGEEMKVEVEGFRGGDRLSLQLPSAQEKLISKMSDLKKPIILVLLNGSAIAPVITNQAMAIVEAWYPGQAGGSAIADVLFGDYNPAGRLPVTFYKSIDQIPAYVDYRMEGKTYRYFKGQPLYSFGFGLSYTFFKYSNLVLPQVVKTDQTFTVSVDVENCGQLQGDEVVQLYLSNMTASVPVPIRSLQGFKRIHLSPGQKQRVEFTLNPRQLSIIDDDYQRVVESGTFQLAIGGSQPDQSGQNISETTGVKIGYFKVEGEKIILN